MVTTIFERFLNGKTDRLLYGPPRRIGRVDGGSDFLANPDSLPKNGAFD